MSRGLSSPEGYVLRAAELKEKVLAVFITNRHSEKSVLKIEVQQPLPSKRSVKEEPCLTLSYYSRLINTLKKGKREVGQVNVQTKLCHIMLFPICSHIEQAEQKATNPNS